MSTIKLGFAPTRRSIFSAPAAVQYADLTRARLRELGVSFIDIDDINPEGLLYDDGDCQKIAEKFRCERVDGLFLPHCNFGTEYVCARLAKALGVPVLLWGPRDERPDENGVRLRDSQCGLFATGKVLRRFGVPFTYLCNCDLHDPAFGRGIKNFLAVCNVVRTFRNIRILQIGPRPFDFFSTICNEGELLERFGVQLSPVPLPELTAEMKRARGERDEVARVVAYCRRQMDIGVGDEALEQVAALKIAVRRLLGRYGCQAAAIQCWNALQSETGIMPCAANSLLNEEGTPVVCETDIHGAITALLAEAAAMGEARSFFADWTVRHPDNPNGELLQHCGPWPLSVAKSRPKLGFPLAFSHPGAIEAEAKHGDITLCRFDGDNGEYSLLLGHAKGIDGPYTKGTYLWVEVQNWPRLEEKLVCGPYIHHCVGIHRDVVPVLYEACKYIGVAPDLYDPIEEEVKAAIRGE
ncbi:MAG: fucose isomerase [Clostridiales bacterium]|uniref:L-fucose/L-arabinose isomerase family protein n=1 Tax=Provencibacterium massiliense TaxID=1841868 RepID=UPI0009A86208|nr:L-fucose/L-arabinose isomerase family protein [Provencibacterium massiliense]PWM37841.1 MAG: fucose isomerase [Clostridiales bacterium]RGB65732.1 fucose isomerase [Harryflintia acetispora]